MFWKRKVDEILNRDSHDEELAEEMRLHLEMKTEELRDAGMPEREAREAARRAFGNQLQFAEDSRRHWLPRWMDEWRQDIRFALRSFAVNRGFVITVFLTMALGIGANTAIFSMVEAVMLRKLPVADPDSLMEVVPHLKQPGRWTSGGNDRWMLSYPLFREIVGAQRSFSCLYGSSRLVRSYAESGNGPWEIRPRAQFVSTCFFDTIGIPPLLGRGLQASDVNGESTQQVVVLSHSTWQQRFSADPAVLGRSITVGSTAFEIVGVMPPGFSGDSPAQPADFWLPLESYGRVTGFDSWNERGSVWFQAMGRLRPSVSRESAEAELTTLLRNFVHTDIAEWKKADASSQATPEMFRMELQSGAGGFNDLRGQYGQALRLLLGIVALLLLLACLNVAGLLMARGTARGHEIAVRLSLGASRVRVMRQLLLESLLLCSGGALFGLLLAHAFSLRFVSLLSKATAPLDLPYRMNGTVLLFTLAVTILATLVSALLPAWQTTRGRLSAQLASAGRSLTQHRSRLFLNRALVTAQVAVGVLLACGAGLMLRTLYNLSTQPVGYEVEHVLVAFLEQAPQREGVSRRSVFDLQTGRTEPLRARLASLHGASAATLAHMAPMSNWMMSATVHSSTGSTGHIMALRNSVSADYFETLSSPLIAGRHFRPEDHASGRRVCIIDEDLAQSLFPDLPAIGQSVSTGKVFDAREAMDVIGVVRANRWFGPKQDGAGQFKGMIWTTLEQERRPFQVALVKTTREPTEIVPALRQAFREEMPELLVTNITTLERLRDDTIQRERLLATLCTGFGGVALVMIFAGLHGLLAYSVERRIRELGVRIALGATRAHLLRLVGNESLALIAAGLFIGLPATWAVSHLLGSFLWEVKPTDPLTYIATLLVMAAIGLTAALPPARRAASVAPTEVLRND
ncbi:MAG: ABC transporter permease [Bryobacterales bacterium]|nr:ABC transporter permease [Bryobacterales bacterium]